MKYLMIVITLFCVACSLDRWENPTAGNDVVDTEQDITEEADQQSNDTSTSSIQSTESTESTESTASTMSTESTTSMGAYPSTALATESDEVIAEPTFDWARVLITEVVTDPQQDFSDSEGGDGIPFNNVPGTGTVSVTDEYIEIFNGTPETIDVSQWSLAMLDGSDETQVLGVDIDNEFFSLDGSINDLGAGEFAVIGNPTGTLNNTITVELYNDLNELTDSVSVDDANAIGLEDEAFTRLPDGSWGLTVATPGCFE